MAARKGVTMKICYLCGELINEGQEISSAMSCSSCGVSYCGKCSSTVTTCFNCGCELEVYEIIENGYTDPEDLYRIIDDGGRRGTLRATCETDIEYFSSSGDDSPAQKMKATTRNISRTGLCIRTKEIVQKGQIIHIVKKFEKAGRDSHSTAEVRWIRKISATEYLAGLKFLNGKNTALRDCNQ
jgi:hypothetical protein